MNSGHVNYYATQADKLERDPYGPDGSGRATVVNGRGFKWQRFHSAETLVWVETIDGKMVGLTPWQNRVYQWAIAHADAPYVRMREMAAELGCSPSTISRALVKLMSWGLLGYITARGRYAGTIIFRMVRGDGFQRFRDAAKAKVREWSRKANERLLRTNSNVAPLALDRGRGIDSLYYHFSTSTSTKGATLKPWTVEELREGGII